MPDLSLVFDLIGRDKSASAVFDKVGDSAHNAGEKAGGMGSMMKGAVGMAAGALIGGGLIEGLHGLYDAAAESAKVSAVTESVVRSTGQAAHMSADQIGDLATALSNKTGMDDEQIQSSENLLLTFTNVRNEVGKGNDVFSQASGLALDMATVMGGDSSAAAMQLGKALNDPVKGIGALSKAGVSFTEQQKTQIRTLVKHGDTLGAQKIILGEVTKEFGGAAAAAATPWDRLQVSLGNAAETVGSAVIPLFSEVGGVVAQVVGVLFSGDFSSGPFDEDSPVISFLFDVRDIGGQVIDVVKGFVGAFTGEGSDALDSFAAGPANAIIDAGAKARAVWDAVSTFVTSDLVPAVQTLAGFLTGTVLPAIVGTFGWLADHQDTVVIIAAVIGALLIPALVRWAVQQAVSGAISAAVWVGTKVDAIAAAAQYVISSAVMVAQWVWHAGVAVVQGAIIAGVWVGRIVGAAVSAAASLAITVAQVVAGWIVQAGAALVQGAIIVGVWALMGVQALIRGAQMAAAWVIAMGPVGWVIAAVVGLVALIIANWDTVVSWTRAAWQWVLDAVQAVWQAIIGAVQWAANLIVSWFMNWTLPGLIISHWSQIRDFVLGVWNAIVGGVRSAMGWVAGIVQDGISAVTTFFTSLPGKILGALGDMGRTLYNAGADLIHGLINGAGSILSKIGSFFLDMVPGWIRGPFESALGISSPSRVFAAYGGNIGQGLINGLSAMRPAVADELARLADSQGFDSLTATLGGGGLGYSAPSYGAAGGPGGAGVGGNTYHTTVSGVASPEQVAAVVDRAQRTNEFLAGAGRP